MYIIVVKYKIYVPYNHRETPVYGYRIVCTAVLLSQMHKQAFCSRRYLVRKATGACTLMYRYELQHSGNVPVLHCERSTDSCIQSVPLRNHVSPPLYQEDHTWDF